ncbi:MAG: hypothetical protein KDA24_04000 [Deltaproteobacteria bacterium]|nr:hypothetical protein [Deltaproteobacteria bacterium]
MQKTPCVLPARLRCFALVGLLASHALVSCATEPVYDLAAGVHIDEVAAYQAIERPLVVDGEEQVSDVPLIQKRTTLLRVFVSTDEAFDGGPVLALFTVGGETFEVALDSLPAMSQRADLESTVNLEVPADLVGPTLEWSVQLLQEDAPGDNLDARHPAEGVASTTIEGRANVLSVVLVPFSYEADGSGRLPDLSPGRVDEFTTLLMSLYPVSEVRVEVHEPVALDSALEPAGASWGGMLLRLGALRESEAPLDDVYYHGIILPAETREEHCGDAERCLNGLAAPNGGGPGGLGSPEGRISIGVGFPDRIFDIAIHELGHTHGRDHTPCSDRGYPPSDLDTDYPREDGMIDAWGWDLVTGELRAPGLSSDLMGYCPDRYISAYTWKALHVRSAVNRSL